MVTVLQRRTSSWVCSCILMSTWMWTQSVWAGHKDPIVIGDIALDRNRHVAMGVPNDSEDNGVVISRAQYVVNWNHDRRGVAWAAWDLNAKELGGVGRTNIFRMDHDLQDYLVELGKSGVKPDEYRNSCLDRGHQVPSGDRTALLADNQATFYMSNMSPQASYLNRITWGSLEKFLRVLVVEQGKDISVYSGTVFGGAGEIGPSGDIEVPTRNFKIAVIKPAGIRNVPIRDMRLLVVDFPNLTSKGTNPVTDREQACYDSQHTMQLEEENRTPYWRSNVSQLDKVEQASGIDFAFLRKIPPISRPELDELIGAQVKQVTPFGNVIQSMTTLLQAPL